MADIMINVYIYINGADSLIGAAEVLYITKHFPLSSFQPPDMAFHNLFQHF